MFLQQSPIFIEESHYIEEYLFISAPPYIMSDSDEDVNNDFGHNEGHDQHDGDNNHNDKLNVQDINEGEIPEDNLGA